MPMPRSLGSSQVTFLPPMKIWPSETSSRPAMQLSKVDFPQPEGPSSTMNSPWAMSRLRCSSTLTLPKLSDRSRMETLCCIGLPLHRTGSDAADEPLAGDEIDRERHEASQDGRGHVHVVFGRALGRVDDIIEVDGHRIVLRAGKDDAEQEVVPDTGDLEDQRHHEDRQRHGQHDLEENAPEARPVDARRLEQFLWQRREVIAEQERQDGHAEDGMD